MVKHSEVCTTVVVGQGGLGNERSVGQEIKDDLGAAGFDLNPSILSRLRWG